VKKINGNSLLVFRIILPRQGLLVEFINNKNNTNKNCAYFWKFVLIKSFSYSKNRLKNGKTIPKLF